MKRLTSDELHTAIRRALEEAARRLGSSEFDGSGRYFSDAELAHSAATGKIHDPKKSTRTPAA